METVNQEDERMKTWTGARFAHDQSLPCAICDGPPTLGLRTTGAALPPPLQNGRGSTTWYHGTSFDPANSENDEDPETMDPGGRVEGPHRDNSEYGANAEHHWNTDFGAHFTSLHGVAKMFASGGTHTPDVQPESRILHAGLHMANPKHYETERDMGKDAVEWAHANGHHFLGHTGDEAKDATQKRAFLDGRYDHMDCKHDEDGDDDCYEESKWSHLNHQGRFGPFARNQTHSISANGVQERHSLGDVDTYLRMHPHREEITGGFEQHLRSKGHDGITYGNSYEGPMGHKCAIAFHDTVVHHRKWQWLHPDKAHLNEPGDNDKHEVPIEQEPLPGLAHHQYKGSLLSVEAFFAQARTEPWESHIHGDRATWMKRTEDEHAAHLHAQRADAEQATNGYMVSPEGKARGIKAEDFFKPGNRRSIEQWGTPEMKAWHGSDNAPQVGPRSTLGKMPSLAEYRRQTRDEERQAYHAQDGHEEFDDSGIDYSKFAAYVKHEPSEGHTTCKRCSGHGQIGSGFDTSSVPYKAVMKTCPKCDGTKQVPHASWEPPKLLPEQVAATTKSDDESHTSYFNRHLDFAKNPPAGTHVWRGEVRHKDDLASPPSVGMHWTTEPAMAIMSRDVPKDHVPVLWEARVDHPEHQAIPRSHPIWQGKHRSLDPEMEVRLKPGASVHVTRAYHSNVTGGEHPGGAPWPSHPQHTSHDWSMREVGQDVPVEHKRKREDHDVIDYSDFGIKSTGASRRYFHSTPYDLGGQTHLLPPSRTGRDPHWEDMDPSEDHQVFLSHDVDSAHRWAGEINGEANPDRPYRIYEVAPEGPVQTHGDTSAAASAKILRQIHPAAGRTAGRSDDINALGRSEHPNVAEYVSGGIGHREGDPTRSVVGFLPTRVVRQYREHDGDWNGERSKKTVAAIREDLRAGKGLKEPLVMDYDHDRGWGYLGEGNHRLEAAHQEGVKTVPVRVYGRARLEAQQKAGIGGQVLPNGDFNDDPRYSPPAIHPHNLTWLGKGYSKEGAVLDTWAPSERLFAPTKGGVDPRLFDPETRVMKPKVRASVLVWVNQFFERHGYNDAGGWKRVYLAGSQASEWYGNNDFDILVGIDYDAFRRMHPDLTTLSDEGIGARINNEFRSDFNDEQWHPAFDRETEWHLTGYVNKDSWDIRKIKPYAAYNVTDNTWAVDPIHEPTGHHFEASEMYYFEGFAAQVRNALALPEPLRRVRCTLLWQFVHVDRSRAFGPHGTGAFDRGNALEKYLDQAPHGDDQSLMAALSEAKFAEAKTAASRAPHTSFYLPTGGGKYHRANPITGQAMCRGTILLDTTAMPFTVADDAVKVHPMVCRKCLGSDHPAVKKQARMQPHRGHDVYGKNDINALFPDGAPITSTPWPMAPRTKTQPIPYSKDLLGKALADPGKHMDEVDPRELHAYQPSITRAGVNYYLGEHYRQTGQTYADPHHVANQVPVVYTRSDGKSLLLSGHHRGAAALLKGEKLQCLHVREEQGDAKHAVRDAVAVPRRAAGAPVAHREGGDGAGGSGGHQERRYRRLAARLLAGGERGPGEPGSDAGSGGDADPLRQDGIAVAAHRVEYDDKGRLERYAPQGHEPAPGEHAIFRGIHLGHVDPDWSHLLLDPGAVMGRIREHAQRRFDRGDATPGHDRLVDFGSHWSTSHSTAHSFSLDPTHGQRRSPNRGKRPIHGAVVELHTTEKPDTSLSQYGESELNSTPSRKHVTRAFLHVHHLNPTLEAPSRGPNFVAPESWSKGLEDQVRTNKHDVPFHQQHTLVSSTEIPLRDIQTGLHKRAATQPYTDYEDPKHTYVRFGDWPKDERSVNHVMGWKEHGVSVYHLNRHGDPIDPDEDMGRRHEHDEHCEKHCDLDSWNDDYGNDTREEMQGRVHRAEKFHRGYGGHGPSERGHLVQGDFVGVGHDGEPLLHNVKRVGDWIEHRHHFIPTAEPHRQAGMNDDEPDEDFETNRPGAHHMAGLFGPPWFAAAHDDEIDAHHSPEVVRMGMTHHTSPQGHHYRLTVDDRTCYAAYLGKGENRLKKPQMVGTLNWFGGKATDDDTTIKGRISGIFVKPAHQRRGLASAMLDHARAQSPQDDIAHSTNLSEDAKGWSSVKASKAQSIEVAGVCIKAADTGRVLMLQRSFEDEDDPARGTWEFPGGHIDDGEDPFAAACREWEEETGGKFPKDAPVVGNWISGGMYQGFVVMIEAEADLDINLDHEDRHVLNPDDPDGDGIEVVAWWDLGHLKGNSAVRKEVTKGTDWALLKKATLPGVKKAATRGLGWHHVVQSQRGGDSYPHHSVVESYIQQKTGVHPKDLVWTAETYATADATPDPHGIRSQQRMDSAEHGYRTNPARVPPVIAIEHGGKREHVDGWHRLGGAEKAGLSEVPAYVGRLRYHGSHERTSPGQGGRAGRGLGEPAGGHRGPSSAGLARGAGAAPAGAGGPGEGVEAFDPPHIGMFGTDQNIHWHGHEPDFNKPDNGWTGHHLNPIYIPGHRMPPGTRKEIQPDHELHTTQDFWTDLDEDRRYHDKQTGELTGTDGAHYLKHPEDYSKAADDDLPQVCRINGKDWIKHGHHRLMADRHLGRPTTILHHDFDKTPPKTAAADAPGLTWHPQAAKDLKRLDRPVQRTILDGLDGILNAHPTTMAQTHPLTGPMKGWYATKVSRGHRIIHQPNDDGGIHVGYVGLHEYGKAIQRLAADEQPNLWPKHPEFRPGDKVQETTPNGNQYPATVSHQDESTDHEHHGTVWISQQRPGRDDGIVGVHPRRLEPHPDAPAEQHEHYRKQKALNDAGIPFVPEAERNIDESDRITVHHLTDRHDFTPDVSHRPHNNTTMGGSLSPRLFVGDATHWAEGEHGYRRPYVAEMTVPRGVVHAKGGYLGEKEIPGRHFDKVHVTRVIPYSEHRREQDEPGYRSDVDTRTWSPKQHRDLLKAHREHLHTEHGWGWNEFDKDHNHVGLGDDDWSDKREEYVRRDRKGKPMTQHRSSRTSGKN